MPKTQLIPAGISGRRYGSFGAVPPPPTPAPNVFSHGGGFGLVKPRGELLEQNLYFRLGLDLRMTIGEWRLAQALRVKAYIEPSPIDFLIPIQARWAGGALQIGQEWLVIRPTLQVQMPERLEICIPMMIMLACNHETLHPALVRNKLAPGTTAKLLQNPTRRWIEEAEDLLGIKTAL